MDKHTIESRQSTYIGAAGRKSAYDLHYSMFDHSRTLLIFAHGYKGFKDWGAWNLIARSFAEAGCDFLKFNFSHNGCSPEQLLDFVDLDAFAVNTYSKELEDILSIIELVRSGRAIPNQSRLWEHLVLIGHSRGGGIATLAAHRAQGIDALITWASVAGFENRFSFDLVKWEEEGVAYVKNGRTGQMMPHKFQFYTDFQDNRGALDIQAAAASLRMPALVLHGERDEAVAYEHAIKLASSIANAELHCIRATQHTFGMMHPWPVDRELPPAAQELVQRSLTFLRSQDLIP